MVIVYFVVALVGAAAAVFALQNVDPVVIRFLGWRIEGHRWRWSSWCRSSRASC